jgi:predicted Zn finger-like uncharacterized protein
LIIRCEKCATTYHLDQKHVEPFGSKVRCSRCGYIFWVEPPSFSFSEDPGFQKSTSNPETFLPIQGEQDAAAIQLQPARKTLWTLATIGVLILIALTARFFYIQYLHPKWSMGDTWSKVFFSRVDPEGNQKISLVNIRKYFKENAKIGQFLIIEGEVRNGYPTIREKVKIHASLMKTGNKVVVERDVFAGWTLTPEELDTLSKDEITRLQSTQPDPMNTRILPGKTLPFMILFPPLPPGSTQVSIEVVGSQKIQSSSHRNLFLG